MGWMHLIIFAQINQS